MKKRLLSVVITTCSMGYQAPSWSQGSPGLEEITVTATRRAQSMQDIPYNISAITGDSLKDAGISDLSKLTRSIPGLTYTDRGPRSSGTNSGVVIRGLNASRLASVENVGSTVPSVSSYIGETPLFVNLHLSDIERVEVLRGPQGTLYGSGSLGGTLRYIHKKPDTQSTHYEVSTRLSHTDGSDSLGRSSEVIANFAINESMAIRLNAGHISRAGTVDAKGLYRLDENNDPVLQDPSDIEGSAPVVFAQDDIDDSETNYARVSWLWDASENVSLQATYQMQRDRANGRRADNPGFEGLGEQQQSIRLNEPLDRDIDLFNFEAEVDLGFATLSSSSSHFSNESDSIRDQTGTYTTAGFWSYYEGNPREIVRGEVSTEETGFVQEIRLTSNTEDTVDWVVGMFYMDHEQEQQQSDYYEGYTNWSVNNGSSFASIVSDLGYTANLKRKLDDRAVFGELTYHVSDDWQMTFGARAFEQTFESGNVFTLPICGAGCSDDGVDKFGTNGGFQEKTFRDQIYKFNTSYDLNEDAMAYFTVAEGFRRGGTNGVPLRGVYAESPEFLTYDPDKATNIELGYKATLFDRIRLSSALFHIEWDDVQIEGSSPNGSFPIAVNGGKAVSKGVEIELSGQLSDALSFNFGYGYVDSVLREGFNVGGVSAVKGNNLPGVAKNSAHLSLNYDQTLSNGLTLSYHLNGSYRDDVHSDINPNSVDYLLIKGYSTWDTSMTLSSDDWSVALFVDNIANERGVSSEYPAARFGDRYGLEYYSKPRSFGVSMSYYFH